MAVTISKDIGQTIKLARIRNNISQQDLHDMLEKELGYEMAVSQISKWETGQRAPRPEVMAALHKILGIFDDPAKTQDNQKATKPGTARQAIQDYANRFELHENQAIDSLDGIAQDLISLAFHFDSIRKLNIIHMLGYDNILEYAYKEFGITKRAYAMLIDFLKKYCQKDEKGGYTDRPAPGLSGKNAMNLLVGIHETAKKQIVTNDKPSPGIDTNKKPTVLREVHVTAGSTMDKIIKILEAMTEDERCDVLAVIQPYRR